jgi:hypothetical protein
MAVIRPPKDYYAKVDSIKDYLKAVSDWQNLHQIKEEKYLSEVWFRGHGIVHGVPLCPGVYRKGFSERAKIFIGKDEEQKRLNVEQRMLDEFRSSGAAFLDSDNIVDVYFLAQHHGMPTRLLDWTTNPLAGLFFAVENQNEHGQEGEVFVMEARRILPENSGKTDEIWGIVGMRHPYTVDAIRPTFWFPMTKKDRRALIIPVRPDNQPGRIGQQSSCFTLHMHKAGDSENETLAKLEIPRAAKASILNELHRMNINQFTIFNDLDHLSKDVKRAWGIK